MTKQATLTLQKVANTHMVFYLNNATWHGTILILIQHTMEHVNPWVIQVHNQDAKIYTPLTHKPLGFEQICAMLQLD